MILRFAADDARCAAPAFLPPLLPLPIPLPAPVPVRPRPVRRRRRGDAA